MPKGTQPAKGASDPAPVTRAQLIELLNEDLSREYQAIMEHQIDLATALGEDPPDMTG